MVAPHLNKSNGFPTPSARSHTCHGRSPGTQQCRAGRLAGTKGAHAQDQLYFPFALVTMSDSSSCSCGSVSNFPHTEQESLSMLSRWTLSLSKKGSF